ncbi:MAG: hypothetical protein V3T77_05190 [Planctomycetota bacterium]
MASSNPGVHFALTSHGLGHVTRTAEVVREFIALFPEVEVVISTTVDEEWLAREIGAPIRYRAQGYEPGMAQRNCFEVDLEATRKAYRSYCWRRKQRLQDEMAFLREADWHGVVCDIPALPVRAAAELGIPVVGVSNITWDWVLEPVFGSDTAIPRMLAEDYQCGQRHLRLPLGPESSPFPESEAAPLVARSATQSPEQVKRRLQIPEHDKRLLAVVCPGGWSADSWEPIHVSGCEDFCFVMVGELPVTADAPVLHLAHSLVPGVSFADLVAAADVMLAKPGYGIASECLQNRTPQVGIERPDFRETPLLVEALRAAGPYADLSLEGFFQGRWQDSLHQAHASPTPWKPFPQQGARQIAKRLGSLFQVPGASLPSRAGAIPLDRSGDRS